MGDSVQFASVTAGELAANDLGMLSQFDNGIRVEINASDRARVVVDDDWDR